PSRQSLTTGSTSQTNTTVAYLDAKRHLEQLQRFPQLLNLKIASEKGDVDPPKSSLVEIIHEARPEPAQKPGAFEKIRRAVTGGVERTARIKLERDRTDISGLAERSFAATYDPYF